MWTVPLATWLSPLFLIRFVRTQKPGRGLGLLLLAQIAVYTTVWQNLVPRDVPYFIGLIALVGILYGLLHWLPYLADRLIAPRLKGFGTTLVFPLAWVTVEYVNALINPYLTWGSLAYTQYGNLPLVQIVSVTGIWGVIFLITWFAAVVNWAWEQGFEWPRIRRGVGLYAGILALVLLFGGLRLAVFPTRSVTASVAGIVAPSEVTDSLPAPEVGFVEPGLREVYQQVLDYYLQRSREQARAGAEIVVWQEYAVYVFEDDEAMFIEHGRELARQENIYLLMGLAVGNENVPDEPVDNKVVWIDPDGEIVWEYTKSFPVPGSPDKTGDGQVPTGDTPYGRIATVICYDMDQPLFIRQAGRADTDVMLVPAYDWKGLESVHTPMASFRAVENGFSMVRVTGDGVSATYDYQGRILAMSNSFTSPGEVMVAHVPTQGTRTIYSVIGDLFAWLCMAGFVVIVWWTVLRASANARSAASSGVAA